MDRTNSHTSSFYITVDKSARGEGGGGDQFGTCASKYALAGSWRLAAGRVISLAFVGLDFCLGGRSRSTLFSFGALWVLPCLKRCTLPKISYQIEIKPLATTFVIGKTCLALTEQNLY